MNAPIVRLYAGLLLMFTLLVVWTSRWAVLEAEELEGKRENRRLLIEEQQIPRGTIQTADGAVLAESRPQGEGRATVFVRGYPQASLFAHPVGYSFVDEGRIGIERSENDFLVGEENEFTSIIDQLRDVPRAGGDLTLTIDAQAQRVATQALEAAPGTGAGAVVAIEPATGAVRVMASVPGFDPNAVPENIGSLNQAAGSPLVNRATQSEGYFPGSTMKVVTAAAALDSGELTPATVLNADSPKVIGGVELNNFGHESFGSIDMSTALTNSVNTYWAQVGEQLGAETMFEYMERFGFNQDPELDYPADQMRASGVYGEDRELLEPGEGPDIGRVAIGQGNLEVTPLQMAEVAATVANGGVLMKPTFVQEVTDPDGRTIEELDPDEQGTVISEEAAAQLTEMMVRVTREGTAAGLTVDGVEFAGKTGTAEVDIPARINQPWFIGFAPASDPQIAVAATVERVVGGTGGQVAGPIATAVMEALLR